MQMLRVVAVVLTRLVHLVAGKGAVEEGKKLLHITSNQHREIPTNLSLVNVSFNILCYFKFSKIQFTEIKINKKH